MKIVIGTKNDHKIKEFKKEFEKIDIEVVGLQEYLKDKEVVLICPEFFGGLPTPRIPSEQINDKVINSNNEDVTKQFVDGANEALKRLQQQNVNVVILKERSPSCGYKKIYDGTFSKTIIDGNGVFAKLAIENGFIIYTESDIENIIKNNG